jgi:hypothetical protein
MKWSSVVAGLAGLLVLGSVSVARAEDSHKVFAGCVAERTDTTIVLKTNADERITIDITWLKPDQRDTLTSECVTVSTTIVDGKYVAESVEEGLDGQRDQSDENRRKEDDDDDDHDGGHDD